MALFEGGIGQSDKEKDKGVCVTCNKANVGGTPFFCSMNNRRVMSYIVEQHKVIIRLVTFKGPKVRGPSTVTPESEQADRIEVANRGIVYIKR